MVSLFGADESIAVGLAWCELVLLEDVAPLCTESVGQYPLVECEGFYCQRINFLGQIQLKAFELLEGLSMTWGMMLLPEPMFN